jgi:hypothetical protein
VATTDLPAEDETRVEEFAGSPPPHPELAAGIARNPGQADGREARSDRGSRMWRGPSAAFKDRKGMSVGLGLVIATADLEPAVVVDGLPGWGLAELSVEFVRRLTLIAQTVISGSFTILLTESPGTVLCYRRVWRRRRITRYRMDSLTNWRKRLPAIC